MYSREEARHLREGFWTAFGQYMRAVPSADGERVSWLNYKTGVKHLYFRMDADNDTARIGIEIAHPDPDIRNLIFAQFEELRNVFIAVAGKEWEWTARNVVSDREISSISKTIEGVSVFRNSDWPTLISFFKPNITALDEFWSMAKHHFDIFR